MFKNSEFFTALEEKVVPVLNQMDYRFFYKEIGIISVAEFKKSNPAIKFLYGPTEWHVEMIIYIDAYKYEFKDLLKIPVLASWVKSNNKIIRSEDKIENELMFFVALLQISLPVIEGNKI